MLDPGYRLSIERVAPQPGWVVDHYRAELYRGDDCAYPVAVAWLSDFRATPLACVLVDFVLVPDQERRRGHATELICRLCERYGAELALTDAIGDAGAGLLAAIGEDSP